MTEKQTQFIFSTKQKKIMKTKNRKQKFSICKRFNKKKKWKQKKNKWMKHNKIQGISKTA